MTDIPPTLAAAVQSVIGHNNPPPDAIDTILNPLRPEFAERGLFTEIDRVAEIVRGANAWATDVKVIDSDEYGARCEDFLKQIRDLAKSLDDKRKAINQPYADTIEATNAVFAPIGGLLRICTETMKGIKARCLAYADNKQREAAKAAAEAARKAQEQADAMKAAAAKENAETPIENQVVAEEAQKRADTMAKRAETAAAAKPTLTGDATGRASGYRTVWSADITDWKLAAQSYADYPKVRETIQREADADAKRLKDAMMIPGTKPKSERKV